MPLLHEEWNLIYDFMTDYVQSQDVHVHVLLLLAPFQSLAYVTPEGLQGIPVSKV